MMTRWNSVEDDRGTRREICLVSEVVKSTGLKRCDVVDREHAGRFFPSFFWGGLFFSVLMQPLFILTGIVPLSMVVSWFFLGHTVFIFVLMGTIWGVISKQGGWRTPLHAKKASLSIGCCTSCTYSIAEITPESDGCTICPECGAAWRLGV
tara:strand:+ start:486 stop:938 length:453 start_codon:yes stop_codon:yes gene_type:complete